LPRPLDLKIDVRSIIDTKGGVTADIKVRMGKQDKVLAGSGQYEELQISQRRQ